MNARAKKLFDEALELPEEERAKLAHDLLDSLEAQRDPEAERLWQKEMERRALQAVRGKSRGRDAEEVIAEARQRLRGA